MSNMEIAVGLLAFWQIVSIVVRLTPTKRDDEITSKVGKVLNLLFNSTRLKGAEAVAVEQEVKDRVIQKRREAHWQGQDGEDHRATGEACY